MCQADPALAAFHHPHTLENALVVKRARLVVTKADPLESAAMRISNAGSLTCGGSVGDESRLGVVPVACLAVLELGAALDHAAV
jgi:hypothetical protein